MMRWELSRDVDSQTRAPSRRALMFALAFALLVPGAASASPVNDDFGSASILPSRARASGSLAGATVEPEEPIDCVAGGTVWYRFEARGPAQQVVTVRSSENVRWTLYRGATLADLERLGCWPATGWPQTATFYPGSWYAVQVSGEGQLFEISVGQGVQAQLVTAGGYLYDDGDAVHAGGGACLPVPFTFLCRSLAYGALSVDPGDGLEACITTLLLQRCESTGAPP